MTTQTPERVSETVAPKRGRMLWMIALIVILVIAVGVGVWFLLVDEALPTVTFDGEVATYDGPTTFDAGTVTFRFDASGSEPGALFLVGEFDDDSMTFDDLEAWADENPPSQQPQFLGLFEIAYATSGDRIVEESIDLRQGMTYAVFANLGPGAAGRAYPVAILEVE